MATISASARSETDEIPNCSDPVLSPRAPKRWRLLRTPFPSTVMCGPSFRTSAFIVTGLTRRIRIPAFVWIPLSTPWKISAAIPVWYRTSRTKVSSSRESKVMTEDTVMPPVDAPRHLTDKEKQILRRWVQQGGKYDQHWAFQKPVQADVPQGANAIDYFVRRRLEGSGLVPSQRADKRQLLRRVTLDLTGPATNTGRSRSLCC